MTEDVDDYSSIDGESLSPQDWDYLVKQGFNPEDEALSPRLQSRPIPQAEVPVEEIMIFRHRHHNDTTEAMMIEEEHDSLVLDMQDCHINNPSSSHMECCHTETFSYKRDAS